MVFLLLLNITKGILVALMGATVGATVEATWATDAAASIAITALTASSVNRSIR